MNFSVRPLSFELTPEQKMIVNAACDVAKDFNPEYWRKKDQNHEFPEDFWKALVEAGFVGIVVPEKYGGGGMGMSEMLLAMETLTSESCGFAGTWFLCLTSIFGGLSSLSKLDTGRHRLPAVPPRRGTSASRLPHKPSRTGANAASRPAGSLPLLL